MQLPPSSVIFSSTPTVPFRRTLCEAVSRSILLLAFIGVISLRGQTLLHDNFQGDSLNTVKWQALLPTGASSLSQSAGVVTTTGRGILASSDQFTAPYVVSGTFVMLSDDEHFNIAFRTDLSSEGENASFERAGILVSFSNDGDEISIQRFTTAADWSLLSGISYSLHTGQSYSFDLTDWGNMIGLKVDGSTVLSASSTYSTGGHLAFYSRETGTSTAIDSLTISAIPEPSAYTALLGCLALGVVAVRRRRYPSI